MALWVHMTYQYTQRKTSPITLFTPLRFYLLHKAAHKRSTYAVWSDIFLIGWAIVMGLGWYLIPHCIVDEIRVRQLAASEWEVILYYAREAVGKIVTITLTVTSDLLLIALPLHILSSFKLTTHEKRAVAFVFFIASISIAAAIGRFVVLNQRGAYDVDKGGSDRIDFDKYYWTVVLAFLEIAAAEIAFVLPALRKVLLDRGRNHGSGKWKSVSGEHAGSNSTGTILVIHLHVPRPAAFILFVFLFFRPQFRLCVISPQFITKTCPFEYFFSRELASEEKTAELAKSADGWLTSTL
ncbi:hypothetical protein K440DRAFT_642716 [Wilcoxina mikolae CBS 423.85]|nr:hypothetical protein K440DRAFT_642716 [Wilcoxina mikolae CBS 423.85]